MRNIIIIILLAIGVNLNAQRIDISKQISKADTIDYIPLSNINGELELVHKDSLKTPDQKICNQFVQNDTLNTILCNKDGVIINTYKTYVPNYNDAAIYQALNDSIAQVRLNMPEAFNYNYFTSNSGNKNDYINTSTQSGDILLRIAKDHTPTKLHADIKNGNLQVINTQPKFGQFTYPAAWDSDTIEVFLNEDGSYLTPIDDKLKFREAYMLTEPNAKTYYVDINTGNNSNNGLTEATAFKTIAHAKQLTDVTTIMVKAGNYFNNDGWVYSLQKSLNIIGYGGIVNTGSVLGATFSQTDGFTNVWEYKNSFLTNVCSAKAIDKNGVNVPYNLVGSIQEVSENTHSYYIAQGATITEHDTVYVNSQLAPDTDKEIFLIRDRLKSIIIDNGSPAISLYLENVKVFGSGTIRNNEPGSNFYANNCIFSHNYSTGNDGSFISSGINKVILNNCTAAYSFTDGFNYHDVFNYNTKPFALELNCKAYNVNLDNIGTSDQASTSHEDYRIIRINGSYQGSTSDIADVNSTMSINFNNKLLGPNITNSSLLFSGAGPFWVINPSMSNKSISSSNTSDIYISGIDYKNTTYNGNGDFFIY